MAEDNTACIGYLVIEEFAEILVVHFALLSVNNGSKAVENDIMCIDILYCTDNIAEFSNAGRLNKYAVGSVISKDLLKRLSEISYQ